MQDISGLGLSVGEEAVVCLVCVRVAGEVLCFLEVGTLGLG